LSYIPAAANRSVDHSTSRPPVSPTPASREQGIRPQQDDRWAGRPVLGRSPVLACRRAPSLAFVPRVMASGRLSDRPPHLDRL